MRIVVHEYSDGTSYAYSTDDNGENEQAIKGERRPGARIQAAIEIVCDDNDRGRRAALDALELVRPKIELAA